MTDQEIETKHNYRDATDQPQQCQNCTYHAFYEKWNNTSTPVQHIAPDAIGTHNCRRFVSLGYTQPIKPTNTCEQYEKTILYIQAPLSL
jgi:hypothetical protein